MTLAGWLSTLNRTQVLVLGFLASAWLALVVILVLAPDVFDQTLKRVPFSHPYSLEFAFLAALSILLVILGIGVVRRWRWAFWLMLAAFLAGILRSPAVVLELAGTIPAQGPPWYEVLQGLIGMLQFAIAIAMLRGFRRRGVWGSL